MAEMVQAYRHVAASDEFKERERMRSKARHDEAQALLNRDEHWKGVVAEKEVHWKGVVAEKDELIARLRAQINEQ